MTVDLKLHTVTVVPTRFWKFEFGIGVEIEKSDEDEDEMVLIFEL